MWWRKPVILVTQEAETRGKGQDHPRLQGDFKFSLDYVRTCLRNKQIKLNREKGCIKNDGKDGFQEKSQGTEEPALYKCKISIKR